VVGEGQRGHRECLMAIIWQQHHNVIA